MNTDGVLVSRKTAELAERWLAHWLLDNAEYVDQVKRVLGRSDVEESLADLRRGLENRQTCGMFINEVA